MNYEIRDEGEMMRLGEELGMRIFDGKEKRRVIELVGDVGAGKTTLVRGVARGLGIKDEVTSPSFTIMKRYSFGEGRAMAHYDFYRLGEAGIMAEDIREQMMVPGTIVIVEWGESVGEILPKERMVLEILMNEDGTRTLRETYDEERSRHDEKKSSHGERFGLHGEKLEIQDERSWRQSISKVDDERGGRR